MPIVVRYVTIEDPQCRLRRKTPAVPKFRPLIVVFEFYLENVRVAEPTLMLFISDTDIGCHAGTAKASSALLQH